MKKRRLRTYDAGHIPAVVVPPDGARCSSCMYLRDNGEGPRCSNRHYQKWAGTNRLVDPATGLEVPPDRFCTDWYDPGRRFTDW